MEYVYHATMPENLQSILVNGIRPSIEGYTFVTKEPKQAAYFLALRGIEEILVLKIKLYEADKKNLIETFDHNSNIVKFKCFGYLGGIEASKLVGYTIIKV